MIITIQILFRQSEDDKKGNIVKNVSRFIKNDNVSGHKKYAYGYLFYLCLHILNVIFNIYLLNVFISGDFLNLGTEFVSFALLKLI